MIFTLRNASLIASLSVAGLLTACGGGGGGGTAQSSGTLGVSMTDTPACGYDAVNVTVNKIRVHQSASAADTDAGWTDITLNPAKKINLLNLTNGALEELGETPLAAGHYTQLRLVLDPNTGNAMANSLVLSGTTNEVKLDTPSAVQSGIKLGHEFDVAPGQRVDLVLDFDACKSIVKRGNSGNYGLKPVVTVIPTVLNGISGFVDPSLANSHVLVSAQQNGVVVRSTVPNATTGEFYLARVVPGSYDVVVTADNSATGVIATVPVATTASTTVVSTNATPIKLLPSSTHTISGTVALPANYPDTSYVSVLAQQRFATGPTVTVKYQGVDITNSSYSLPNLPTAAPQFGQYSPTLPITLTTRTDTTPGTGKYTVQATADGYASKTATLDLNTADQTSNFAFP
ncbi:MAG: DUF4382 domain-containing protein [Herbaspirillum sp.]